MLIAQADITDGLLIVNKHLLAHLDHLTCAVYAGVHGGFAAAPAQAGAVHRAAEALALQLNMKGPNMEDCIFCKIAAHEIPSTVVYEDDQVIAFDDLNPQAPVHTLVIPKEHYANICDGVPGETLAAMVHAVDEVVRAKGLTGGFRVITNTGADACQTVMHFHMHVLGGCDLGENLI